MKFILFILSFVCLSVTSFAQGSTRHFEWLNLICKRQVAIGRNNNQVPDSSAWLQLGDTGTTRGILLGPTDTSKILKKTLGTIIFNRGDSLLYFYNGKKWIKVNS